ncbi:hypothetical protein AK812_SmicGene49139 [Symbiodinium microadriaticum]|uniref:Uncharacterized protein n=1 Tax=Symbiodinium microadriaticum TaxID=2951 RepID=A0A1Q9EI54_SYMMI|nr:hypothetical protein AK812_SmicGene49139 [Symbiodinium microadriaticum]
MLFAYGGPASRTESTGPSAFQAPSSSKSPDERHSNETPCDSATQLTRRCQVAMNPDSQGWDRIGTKSETLPVKNPATRLHDFSLHAGRQRRKPAVVEVHVHTRNWQQARIVGAAGCLDCLVDDHSCWNGRPGQE